MKSWTVCQAYLRECKVIKRKGRIMVICEEPSTSQKQELITLSLGSKTGRIAWAAAQTLSVNHAAFHKRNPAEHTTVIGYRR